MKENPLFSLEILRDDWIPRLKANFKLEDAFQRLCHDLLQHRLNNDPALTPVQLVPFPTPGADRYEGCIIHGEGGTGKTRLMLELGLRAQKDNWLVYKITPALQKLEDLEPQLYPGSRHLLLFDYIEENPAYTADLLEKLALLAEQATIKVIAK